MSKLLDQIDKDLPVFFDSHMGFATDVVVGGVPIKAIFDRDYLSQSVGNNIYVEGSVPVLICATPDVSTFAHGQVVTGLPDAYKVVNIGPDQTGETLVYLELQ